MQAGVRIGKADVDLVVDEKKLLVKLVEIAVKGAVAAFGEPTSALGFVGSLTSLLDTASIEEPDESKAWALIALSLAIAVEDLRPETVPEERHEEIMNAFKGVVNQVKTLLDDDTKTYVLDLKFFSCPSSLPLYQDIRPNFASAFASLRLDAVFDTSQFTAQLDEAFNKAVYEVSKLKHEYFKSLFETIDAPGRESAQHGYDWDAYRERLRYQFEVKPVFGQEETKVSLSQMYVAPRARVFEPAKPGMTGGQFVTWAHEEVERWITEPNVNNATKLFCGGPGRGKSSFAKALASELSQRQNLRPIFIELQYISLENNLSEEVANYLVGREEAFETSPLEKEYKDFGGPFVFIFDGLDELARPGSGESFQIARRFSDQLIRLLGQLNSESHVRAFAVITGRTPIIQDMQSYDEFIGDPDVVELLGYAPIDGAKPSEDPSDILGLDQRIVWWRKYANAVNKPQDIPAALASTLHIGLSDEPLLCYLMALSGYVDTNRSVNVYNQNAIYNELLTAVWERGWGNGRKGPTRAVKSKQTFDALLEAMALATWHGDGSGHRIASAEAFESALKVANAEDAWEEFQGAGGGDAQNFALTFYLKTAKKEGHGIEFTHKSFSEYLTARLLFRNSMELAEQSRNRSRSLAELYHDWMRIAGPAHLTEGMLQFLQNEAILLEQSNLENSRMDLEELFSELLDTDIPSHSGEIRSFEKEKLWRTNSEINLLACLNATTRGTFYHSKHKAGTSVLECSPPWPLELRGTTIDWRNDDTRLANLLKRILDIRGQTGKHICLTHTNLSGCQAHSDNHSLHVVLPGLFLPEISLEFTNFCHAQMPSSCFSNANISGTCFDKTDLRNADFSGANLTNVNFGGANLDHANFAGASLHKVRFGGANLSNADFKECQMTDVTLTAKDMTNLDLRGVTFDSVDCSGVDLREVVIDKEHLHGLRLDNAQYPEEWKPIP